MNMAPIRFVLKPSSKKRRRWESGPSDEKEKRKALVCSVFDSIGEKQVREEECGDDGRGVERRVALLEDVRTKVERLKGEGNTLAEAGRYRAAMRRWREALGEDPRNAALYELLAQASMALYEDFEAVLFARKATDLAPTWSDGFLTLARCQLNFGELTLALEALHRAVELDGGVWTDEMASDRREIDKRLAKQEQILRKRDEEAAREVELDKLQVISCFKHLTLRAKTGRSLEGSK
uniref:Tetratricopeptide repeat protein 33 n=1 Tax=Peronospora matthiolae TaxID=2874970 RepID=A0AAV1VL40_9STRA